MMADMADPSYGPKPLRVLLSEGNSTSAREAITVLGLAGHIVRRARGFRGHRPTMPRRRVKANQLRTGPAFR